MSVYDDLNLQWQKDWLSESKTLNRGDSYINLKNQFMNDKLEDLKISDRAKFNQYCGDFASEQNSKRKIWGVANAGVLGVGVGLVVSAFLSGTLVTPLFLGAMAAVVVAKAITSFKNRRYKLSTSIINVLRGTKKEIDYVKFTRKSKEESYYHKMTREEFLASEDYPTLIKASQIPPAVAQYFKDTYYPEYEVIDVTPISVTESDMTKPYVPTTIVREEAEPKAKVDARKWFRILAPIAGMLISAYINSNSGSSSSRQGSTSTINSPINPQKREMSL